MDTDWVYDVHCCWIFHIRHSKYLRDRHRGKVNIEQYLKVQNLIFTFDDIFTLKVNKDVLHLGMAAAIFSIITG